MEMSGEQRVPLAQDEVWKALNDPDVLGACIPGCEHVEKVSDTEFKATVNAAVGPVKSKFKGKVTLSDLDPPNSYRLAFQGDGSAGFVKGEADVRLNSEDTRETVIGYQAKATVGGKLAQVGSRLIDGAARKMANDFFANLTRHLGGTYDASDQKQDQKAAPEPSPAHTSSETPSETASPEPVSPERETATTTATPETAHARASDTGSKFSTWVVIGAIGVLIVLFIALT